MKCCPLNVKTLLESYCSTSPVISDTKHGDDTTQCPKINFTTELQEFKILHSVRKINFTTELTEFMVLDIVKK